MEFQQPTTNTGSPSVVVTGAAGGMGCATVDVLLEAGWRVLALDRDEQRLQTVFSDRLSKAQDERIRLLGLDLAAPNGEAALMQALEGWPAPVALVNMAGRSSGGRHADLSLDDWTQSFEVNVTAAMRLIRCLSPAMQAQGAGSIVNVGSPVGVVGAKKWQYAASKAALHGLTMSVARSLGASGVRCNLLLPGPTITGMTSDWSEEVRDQVAQGTVLKRLCTPKEVAQVVRFLVSSESSYMTASVVDMTAGSMMGHG